jgi:proteasome lid subunit RPN8/RPN11
MGMAIRVSRSVPIGIRRISADCAPREACGLLFGDGDAITGFQATENVAEEPERRFEIDPVALFAALRAERAGGPKIVGYWHSHPSGDATPSVTDAEMAAPDGKLWLIVAGEATTLWRAGQGGALHGRFDNLAFLEGEKP